MQVVCGGEMVDRELLLEERQVSLAMMVLAKLWTVEDGSLVWIAWGVCRVSCLVSLTWRVWALGPTLDQGSV